MGRCFLCDPGPGLYIPDECFREHFEDVGSLMAHEGYLMPRDLPPAAIATAPVDFQATIRRLAG